MTIEMKSFNFYIIIIIILSFVVYIQFNSLEKAMANPCEKCPLVIEKAYGEAMFENIGDGRMIALIRKSDGGRVRQITSFDYGKTWSDITLTNLGESYGIKIPYIYYDKEINKLITIYMDREKYESDATRIGWGKLLISISDVDDVFDNAIWNNSTIIDDNYFANCCGYPSLVKLSNNTYYYLHSKEVNKTNSDIYGGYLRINNGIEFENELQIDTKDYESFGQLLKKDNRLFYFGREADTHHLKGKISKWEYENSEWKYGGIIYDSKFDDRAGRGGVINGTIYLFILRAYDGKGEDMGYIFSRDDGETWSDYIKIDLKLDLKSYSPYGKIIESQGKYYMPYYGYKDKGRIINFFVTEDNGKTWEDRQPIIWTSIKD